MPFPTRFLPAALMASVLAAAMAAAAPTGAQRAELAAVGTLLTKAGNLYKESKFKEAGDLVKEVQTRLDKLAGGADAQWFSTLQGFHGRLVRAHALLELEGVTLPELKPLEKPSAGKPGTKGMSTVSFVKDVAPILNARCGSCHVRNARGMFSMATYESLMKGSPAGKVVFPGNLEGSDLVLKVQDKEMPPSGAGIPDAELTILKTWVEEGAKFDGEDPKAQLTSLIKPGTGPAETPTAKVELATGNETISFARDIAPIFVKSCTGCHRAQNPPNNFNMTTMTSLLRGGDRGQPILPGKAADSLLVKKLKGTADGARMPQRAQPLDEATIAKIEKWIAEGAKFDGPDAGQPIVQVAAIAKARAATHEELSAERANLADKNWRLAMPNLPPSRAESTNFLVLGNMGENTLADIAKRAEAVAPKVADIFKAPRNKPLIKGRMTLFVFSDRYDYSEFGKMVDGRDLPPALRGHHNYSIVDAYGAVLNPKSADDYSLDALVAQQLAAVYASAQGKGTPKWFAEGCGRVVASRLAGKGDHRVAQWNEELSGIVGNLIAPDDFLKEKLSPEDNDVCNFGFVKFLMNDARHFGQLLDALRKGGDFNKSFADAFGGKPEQLAASWTRIPLKADAKTGAKKGGRRGR